MSTTTNCQRLCSFGVKPSEASAIAKSIEKSINCNGMEWTVERVKGYKNWLAQHYAGNTEFKVPWIAYDAHGPKGPWSIFWRRRMTQKKMAKAFQCLNICSQYVSPKATSKQWKKFYLSATKPTPNTMHPDRMQRLSTPYLDRATGNVVRVDQTYKKAPELLTFPFSVEKRVPSYPCSVSASDLSWVTQEMKCAAYIADYRHPRLREVLPAKSVIAVTDKGRLLTGLLSRGKPVPMEIQQSIGNISLIQEAGFKLRCVGNPRMVYQLALMPLKDSIMDYLKYNVTTDYTFDQRAAVPVIQGWMKNGQKIYSVDLSDATNAFPLDFQLQVLHKIGCNKDDLDLFERVSKRPWYVPHLKTSMRFEKGQPLGLGPSFGSFALAHNVLLHNLSLGLNLEAKQFCVLGDDVCIGDENLNRVYREVLLSLGCPVSESKTLESKVLATFAGYVIFRNESFPVGKWHNMSDRNFVDVIRIVGPKGLSLLKARQRKVVETILEVPEVFGGMGFNPKGKSLETRIAENRTIIQQLGSKEAGLQLVHQDLVFKTNVQSFLGQSLTVQSDVVHQFRARPGPRSLLTSINDFHHIMTATVEKSKVEKPYVSLARESDPRGSTLLQVLERKLEINARHDAHVELTEPSEQKAPETCKKVVPTVKRGGRGYRVH